ncbi:MAG: efflux RND transporter permease subunit [bacterium]|nr:efflux RND transporter permease subunit [bacterium]
MKKIVSTFIKYPFYANLIVFFLLVAGFIGLFNLKKSFFPERTTKDITITIRYPGASPKEMEEGLTDRIEEAVRGIVGIKEITSTSSENFALVRVTTTGEYDLDNTLLEIKNAVDGISSFPADAERPIVNKQRTSSRAMFLGLSGDVDLLTLKKYANRIEKELLASRVVSQVRVAGLPPIEISVEVTEETLLRYNLTFDEISRAITRNNRDISAGMIKSLDQEMLIRSRARSVNPDVIGNIILRAGEQGAFLRIRDIANVKMKFSDVANKSFLNGKRVVGFGIEKLVEEDLEEISQYIHNYVEEFNSKNQGVVLDITFDFLPMLYSRLDLMYKNGGIGLVLVIICLGLFLSTRLSFWVAWGIPASFLAMFIVAYYANVTINMISLFGMILVVGILVDDGIVIAENIYTHFEKGKSPARAAVDGTMEVLPAVTTSVATTIVAFMPMLYLTGRMQMLYEMAFVVIVSLAFSLFEAFFVLPAHVGSPFVLRPTKDTEIGTPEKGISGGKSDAGEKTAASEHDKGVGLFKKIKDKSHFLKKIRIFLDKKIKYMRHQLYGRLLKLIIRWKWVVCTIPAAIFIITIGLFSGGLIHSTFFPPIQFDFFNINVAFKPGAGEKQTLTYLQSFDEAVWKMNEGLKKELDDPDDVIDYTRITLGNAFNGQETGSHTGQIFVILKDMEGCPLSSYDVINRIRKRIGKVLAAEKFSIGGVQRFGKPVSLSLLSEDFEELNGAKAMLKKSLNEFSSLSDVTDNNAPGMQEVLLTLKPKAYFLGMDLNDITRQVRQGFFGGQAQRLQLGKDEVRVWVRYPKSGRKSLGQLETTKIKTPKGEFPLTQLAAYSIKRGPVSIKHYNGAKEIRVEADLVDPYTPVPPILEHVKQNIIPQIKAKYPGISVMHQGQQRQTDETVTDMKYKFLMALAGILLLLMIHFKSFFQPMIVLAMIPLAWLASTWGHGLEGVPVCIFSAFGMVALSGVVINDAVVFLSKYNNNLLEGMEVEAAAYDAGIARFRAILLTSITTVAGLYPIVLEQSFQAQFLKPMAVTLAYGVLFGTFFILVFFPVFILILNDIKVWFKWLLTGKKPAQRDVEVAVINSRKKMD